MTYCFGTSLVTINEDGRVEIEHVGNMGDTIETVNKNLKEMNFISIDRLKEIGFPYEESGSPDSLYSFKITLC